MTIKMMLVVLLVIMAIMMLMMNLSVSKLSSALIAKFEIVLSLARRSYLYCGTVKLDKKHHHRRRQHHHRHRHHRNHHHVFIITWSLLLFLNQAISGGGFPPEVRQVRLTMSPWKVHSETVLFIFDENLLDFHTKFFNWQWSCCGRVNSMNLSIGTFDVPQNYRRSRRVWGRQWFKQGTEAIQMRMNNLLHWKI